VVENQCFRGHAVKIRHHESFFPTKKDCLQGHLCSSPEEALDGYEEELVGGP